MTTPWLKTETALHHGLPFRTVRSWPLTLVATLPVDHQVRHFMGDGMGQKISEVFLQQDRIDAQTGLAAAGDSGLAGAATSQREVDLCIREFDRVKSACTRFRLADSLLRPLQNLQLCLLNEHIDNRGRGTPNRLKAPENNGMIQPEGFTHKHYNRTVWSRLRSFAVQVF